MDPQIFDSTKQTTNSAHHITRFKQNRFPGETGATFVTCPRCHVWSVRDKQNENSAHHFATLLSACGTCLNYYPRKTRESVSSQAWAPNVCLFTSMIDLTLFITFTAVQVNLSVAVSSRRTSGREISFVVTTRILHYDRPCFPGTVRSGWSNHTTLYHQAPVLSHSTFTTTPLVFISVLGTKRHVVVI